jgi:predicted AAA+ superfamily ATPase
MKENIHIPYTHRHLDPVILGFIKQEEAHKKILLVEGARQVGKSWLVNHALDRCGKTAFRLNLEKETALRMQIDDCGEFSAFAQLIRDRVGFDPAADQVLFVDEAQESRKLGHFVRFMKEDWPRATVILSGSTLARLFRNDTRYPVGRVQSLTLRPYSFSEFLRATGSSHLADAVDHDDAESISEPRHRVLLEGYDTFMRTGGLPAVVHAGPDESAVRMAMTQIMADYQNDFIRLFGEEDASIVRACFRSVANFVGGPSKNTSVIPSPGSRINARINEIFSRLESWHMILRSDQRGPGMEASHAYLPKRYLFDTGLLRYVRESAVPGIQVLETLNPAARQPLGGVIENQVALDLSRHDISLQGWKKTPSGGEIDFIIKTHARTCPVECKASLAFTYRNMRGITDYLGLFNQPVVLAISCAPFSMFELPEKKRVFNIPVYLAGRLREWAEA